MNGLERLSASFPWLAGKVVNEGSGEGNSGIFKVKPLEKIPRLVVKDLIHEPSIPTMDALRRANFPFSMLDETIIAPYKTHQEAPTIPHQTQHQSSSSKPISSLAASCSPS